MMRPPLFNLHNHSHYCDGSSPPEEYVLAAIKKGFHTLGFSSHAPVPFENTFAIKDESALFAYADEIKTLKEKYKSKINIFLALEIDFIPEISSDFNYFRNLVGLDYVIGGVHLVKNHEREGLWFIDGPKQQTWDEGLELLFDNDVRLGVTAYWKQVREMISTQNPDIVAHPDKIKMHNKNRYFTENEPWYLEQLDETLELIAKKGTIVEVNTRGLYKGRFDELFPGKTALRKIFQMGIPITLNSDAHRPEELTGFFDEARKILKEIGFGELKLFTARGWENVAI